MGDTDDHTIHSSSRSSGGDSGLGSAQVLPRPSPFLIHNSDNPSQLFVGELLTKTNYGEWVGDITDSFIAKNKLGFVDGSISAPDIGGEDYAAWKQANAMVKGWLKTAMTKNIRSSVRFARTTRDIWVDLQSRFGHGSAARMYELKRTINLLQQEKTSITTFYTKLRGHWDELSSLAPSLECTCGGCTCDVKQRQREAKEGERLFDFLMELDDAFSTVRTQILAMKPIPSLGEAYHLIMNEEQSRHISNSRRPRPDAAVFQAQGERRSDRVSSQGERDADGKPVCSHCQKPGHFRETCYKLIGYPPRKEGEQNGKKKSDRAS
ncbi:unnamed protein product [Linum trigynum]|uniref:Retrotransposon Copia-like N-terminal domain-containing protein n=1 Tax=Linum trigynum TaxID=586398 RepID=A0AAV2FQ68_9ROSI